MEQQFNVFLSKKSIKTQLQKIEWGKYDLTVICVDKDFDVD